MTEPNDERLNTPELLMELIKTTSQIREAVGGLDRRLSELTTNTTAQLATLQERQGATEARLGVHENRISRLEKDVVEAKIDREAVEKEVENLKLRLYVLIGVLSAGGGLAGGLLGKLLGL